MAGSENSSSKAPGLAERPLSGNRDGRFGSSAPVGLCSRLAAIQESLRRPRCQGGKLPPNDANGRPHQTRRSPRPRPTPAAARSPSPGFAATPKRFPEMPCGARPGTFRQHPQRSRNRSRNEPGGGSPPDASTTTRRPKLLAAHGEATGRRVRRVARKNSSPSAAAPHGKKFVENSTHPTHPTPAMPRMRFGGDDWRRGVGSRRTAMRSLHPIRIL